MNNVLITEIFICVFAVGVITGMKICRAVFVKRAIEQIEREASTLKEIRLVAKIFGIRINNPK